ncbi:LysR substrate-binding domain-containing protein [Mesorhizobium sp.]|uniref:LysR substrate-binding domain-containing protein n=1 Tax=Mesorhizobium sp. TaxID=1871066 RepID=UPI00122BEFDC|nr:LysR substrate-binding domain-containing protein [Mesorhizobium sp.]TIO08263.1 MAG: LysR family transcriptional regulator [Mesorhizobium sp.]TIO29829.1 MAG: LysR family transcriptional regulator [Mesorhizobium sp.]
MRKLPPLGSLRAFEAAARRMSFREAAIELGVTPTAISHQIRLLESVCGQPLFRRRPRPLVLTEVGERLFPVIRNGFDAFATAIASASAGVGQRPLRVTSPNAFASRWLVPRLPKWREEHSKIPLEIIGTDSVLDLRAGNADVAIRYARRMPPNLAVQEIFRDTFFPVCSPELLAKGTRQIERAADVLQYPLIHFDWMNRDREAPTWSRWLAAARSVDPDIPDTNKAWDLSFREELHAIDAVVAGQGIAICSDVVVSRELKSGALVKAHDLSLPGYGFYFVYVPDHPLQPHIEAFSAWMRSLV